MHDKVVNATDVSPAHPSMAHGHCRPTPCKLLLLSLAPYPRFVPIGSLIPETAVRDTRARSPTSLPLPAEMRRRSPPARDWRCGSWRWGRHAQRGQPSPTDTVPPRIAPGLLPRFLLSPTLKRSTVSLVSLSERPVDPRGEYQLPTRIGRWRDGREHSRCGALSSLGQWLGGGNGSEGRRLRRAEERDRKGRMRSAHVEVHVQRSERFVRVVDVPGGLVSCASKDAIVRRKGRESTHA